MAALNFAKSARPLLDIVLVLATSRIVRDVTKDDLREPKAVSTDGTSQVRSMHTVAYNAVRVGHRLRKETG